MLERNALFKELTGLGLYKELEVSVDDSVQCTTPPNLQNRPTLRVGSQGEHVNYLQRRLNCHQVRYANNLLAASSRYQLNKPALMPLRIDGLFGPKTHQAVIAFQEGRHLTNDGVVGPRTWNKLNEHKGSIIRTGGMSRRVTVKCPGELNVSQNGATFVVIAGPVQSRFGLSNLVNVGKCELAIGAWDREGPDYKNKKILHGFRLKPGQRIERYQPPDSTAEVTVACNPDCEGTGSLELDMSIS